jgi:uncharacterized protein YutE (UPF0331/DUF86 family)
MTLDPALVTRKLLLVAADIEPLREIRDRGADAYVSSRIDQAVVERLLERAVGRMIDVNYHLITASGQPPPADYHSSFLKLTELGVLDADFARRIARAAGLRNRIVHDYDDLDPRKVFEALGDALRDVPVYLARINEYMKRASSGTGAA